MEERHYQSGIGGNKGEQRRRQMKKLFRVLPGGKQMDAGPSFDTSALRNDSFLKNHYLERKPTPTNWLETE